MHCVFTKMVSSASCVLWDRCIHSFTEILHTEGTVYMKQALANYSKLSCDTIGTVYMKQALANYFKLSYDTIGTFYYMIQALAKPTTLNYHTKL